VTFRKIGYNKGNKQRHYFTRRSDCRNCPIKSKCLGKAHEKKIAITYYMEEYERAIARSKTRIGKKMKSIRQSTVEPVFGTLIEYLGMRKMNTIGIRQANKNMLMAAVDYNLKKYLKFDRKIVGRMAKEAEDLCLEIFQGIRRIFGSFKRLNILKVNSQFLFQGILRIDYIESYSKLNMLCATGTMASMHRVSLQISSAVPVWYFGGLKRPQHAELPKAAWPAQRFNPSL
jgi:hypothetical protein